MFWFLTYRFTAVPILLVAPAFALLGVLVPLGVYRSAARRTVVERLRGGGTGEGDVFHALLARSP